MSCSKVWKRFACVLIIEQRGEERAWSRRLAKRFGCDGRVDDRTFVITGDGSPMGVLDHEVVKEGAEKQYVPFFADVDRKRGDVLVAFGWLMAEDLVKMFATPQADE